MIKVTKGKQFIKQESKYLKKLNPKQRDQYHEKVDSFIQNVDPNHIRLKTHPLKGVLRGKHAFTCCTLNGRDDRIMFDIKEGGPDYYELELVEFLEVGDHRIYE